MGTPKEGLPAPLCADRLRFEGSPSGSDQKEEERGRSWLGKRRVRLTSPLTPAAGTRSGVEAWAVQPLAKRSGCKEADGEAEQAMAEERSRHREQVDWEAEQAAATHSGCEQAVGEPEQAGAEEAAGSRGGGGRGECGWVWVPVRRGAIGKEGIN
ncbi:hypothetical protein PR202_gb15683 [Eleusine coracana subsp. coracana]|uniref:Uncharacterized protein n=1 Tax=Eleusine coracana subsp. coracana TaxID=191504 RepID=A0AAV5EYM3_ELECO|nr:hypothetical protein PR202_gb15683 [Eleusine coracana subsp. coracana]